MIVRNSSKLQKTFSYKGLNWNKMALIKNDQTISYESTILTLWTDKITKKSKLKPTETETKELTLSELLNTHKDHQSIVKIRSQINDENNLFSFKPVTCKEEPKTNCPQKNRKISLSCTVPVKIFELFRSFTSFQKIWSVWLSKLSTNSLLSHTIKMFDQINCYTKPYLSDLLRVFLRHHSPQHCLLKIIENGIIFWVMGSTLACFS